MTDLDHDPRYGRQAPRRYYGKYPGTVTDNGPPSSGDHRGQIKVQVPGIPEETPDGSGNQALEVLAAPAFLPGFFFVPDNGAKVFVEFVAGDINKPIWTGVWYPKDTPPKAIKPDDPTQPGSAPTLDQKIIRTRSGQVIQLEDTDQGEQLVLRDEAHGSTTTFSSTGITVWATASGGNVTLQFGGGSEPTATVVMEDKKITVAANQKQTIQLDETDSGPRTTITDDTNGNAITLSASGITFEDKTHKNKITFDASGITLDAPNGIKLKCGDTTSVTLTSSTIELSTGPGGVTATIDGAALDVK